MHAHIYIYVPAYGGYGGPYIIRVRLKVVFGLCGPLEVGHSDPVARSSRI